jgi:hypothetical protein
MVPDTLDHRAHNTDRRRIEVHRIRAQADHLTPTQAGSRGSGNQRTVSLGHYRDEEFP